MITDALSQAFRTRRVGRLVSSYLCQCQSRCAYPRVARGSGSDANGNTDARPVENHRPALRRDSAREAVLMRNVIRASASIGHGPRHLDRYAITPAGSKMNGVPIEP